MRSSIISVILVFLLSGGAVSCNLVMEEANGDEKEAGAVSGETGTIAGLPCFECHSYSRFSDERVFPHRTHRGMGLHCNQCHKIKSHSEMSLRSSTCKSCHNLGEMELAMTGMPALFDHETHSSMFPCGECHSGLFRMKVNSVRITMDGISRGKYCGRCHNGSRAFPADNCAKCHTGA